MKTAKELKYNASSRLMYCFGELCTLVMLSIGGLSAFVLAFMIAARLIEDSGAANDNASVAVRLIIAAISVLVILIVAATPLSYGANWYRLQQIRGNSVHARSIFSCYTSVRKMWQVLMLNSMVIIKILYVIIPCAIVSALSFWAAGAADSFTNGNIAYYLLFFAAMVITFAMILVVAYASVKYSAVPFLYALEPDRPAAEIIKESQRIMKGKERYISEVMSSLSLCLIPCLLIFPIIFILPYMKMVFTAAVNEIIVSERSEDRQENGSFNIESPLTV